MHLEGNVRVTNSFWKHLETLSKTHRRVFDRPTGSTHPRYPDLRYPLDYGYLEGTSGGDGDGIDLWGGSGDRDKLSGVVCTVDTWKRDAEIKLLLGCSEREMKIVLEFHNSGSQGAILIPAPD
jgi:inorganic pyrophosphatase